MISGVTGSVDDKVAPYQQPLQGNIAYWLSLAAAPTFAFMAALTALFGGNAGEMLCSSAPHPSPLTGMVAMYTLMSAFHATAWLKLISRRPRARDQRAGNQD